MTPLDRINAILSSPRQRYVSGEIEYDEYRALCVRQTPEQGENIFRASGARQSDDGEKGIEK
jgi:hypothetical protein